jgi:hypothetical protein
LNFLEKCPRLTNSVKGCKKVFRFIQVNYQMLYSNVKNASAALRDSFTPEDFDLSSGNITALNGT